MQTEALISGDPLFDCIECSFQVNYNSSNTNTVAMETRQAPPTPCIVETI